jgi:hypothetical protein
MAPVRAACPRQSLAAFVGFESFQIGIENHACASGKVTIEIAGAGEDRVGGVHPFVTPINLK